MLKNFSGSEFKERNFGEEIPHFSPKIDGCQKDVEWMHEGCQRDVKSMHRGMSWGDVGLNFSVIYVTFVRIATNSAALMLVTLNRFETSHLSHHTWLL